MVQAAEQELRQPSWRLRANSKFLWHQSGKIPCCVRSENAQIQDGGKNVFKISARQEPTHTWTAPQCAQSKQKTNTFTCTPPERPSVDQWQPHSFVIASSSFSVVPSSYTSDGGGPAHCSALDSLEPFSEIGGGGGFFDIFSLFHSLFLQFLEQFLLSSTFHLPEQLSLHLQLQVFSLFRSSNHWTSPVLELPFFLSCTIPP